MDELGIKRAAKCIIAYAICLPALAMPYHARILYIDALSRLLHVPFRAFGALADYLLKRLNIEQRGEPIKPLVPDIVPTVAGIAQKSHAVVLYSGGTDSTCAAALVAERFSEVHLLTYYEHATRNSPTPTKNVARLVKHFKNVAFVHRTVSVDALVRYFWYERYLYILRTNGFLVLATPGFSSLSWHVRTIVYCLENDIEYVADGLTRELMHFPGHMDLVVSQWRALYAEFGITYENPVRDWHTPPDQQFIDHLLVNRHGGEFMLGDASSASRKTTGQYLFAKGIFPHPNLKGSKLDFEMQHDCYPFSLYNMLAFWGHLTREPYEVFENKISELLSDKIKRAAALLHGYRSGSDKTIAPMIL